MYYGIFLNKPEKLTAGYQQFSYTKESEDCAPVFFRDSAATDQDGEIAAIHNLTKPQLGVFCCMAVLRKAPHNLKADNAAGRKLMASTILRENNNPVIEPKQSSGLLYFFLY